MRVTNLIQNGCLIGYDEYAKNELGADPEPPSQTLVFLPEQYGLIADRTIYVEPEQVLYPDKGAPMMAWQPDGMVRSMPRLSMRPVPRRTSMVPNPTTLRSCPGRFQIKVEVGADPADHPFHGCDAPEK
ncbi:hypothetical protein [Neoroseomonas lacus]|uniref:Uncharacterized protein n=1 Tax=Neoroseomonas lacus TaxID=287609 RepID=A0A917NTH4_9PROT|nr:hypothetical protein [Neoroseomonas lacus]GGJ23731.1 hypothetical protein GCM10011320_33820 [Neoroseomonas lacus]